MNLYISQRPLLWSVDSFVPDTQSNIILIIRDVGGNNREDLNVTLQWQHELSTQTSNEGTPLCAQHCKLGMFLLEKHQWGPAGSGPIHWFRVIPGLLNTHQAARARAATPIKFQRFASKRSWKSVDAAILCHCPRLLTVCARCSCNGRVAGFGRCRVSTVLRPVGTDWLWEDMLAQPLPLQAGSGCRSRANAVHYWLILLASYL